MKRPVSLLPVARARKKKRATSATSNEALSAARPDKLHESGTGISRHMDFAQARRPGRAVQRVNVDFPVDLLNAIDREAMRIGGTRQAFIKLRLADSLAAPR